MDTAMESLIETYGLAPHPEGGYYREIYRSDLTVRSDRAAEPRAAATHIYFLLGHGQISRFHRVIHDEIWHLYQGDPLRLICYDGAAVTSQTIGPGQAEYAAVVPGNTWQAAETTGDFSFMGCTVAPGFDFKDFSFLSDLPEDLAAFQKLGSEFGRFL